MREAGFATSGKGGTASKSRKKPPESKKGPGDNPRGSSRGKGRARGQGKTRGSNGRDKVHTVGAESGDAAVLPPHPCSLSEDGDSEVEGSQDDSPSSFQ